VSRPDEVRQTLGELLIAGLPDVHPDDVDAIAEVAERMLESAEAGQLPCPSFDLGRNLTAPPPVSGLFICT